VQDMGMLRLAAIVPRQRIAQATNRGFNLAVDLLKHSLGRKHSTSRRFTPIWIARNSIKRRSRVCGRIDWEESK